MEGTAHASQLRVKSKSNPRLKADAVQGSPMPPAHEKPGQRESIPSAKARLRWARGPDRDSSRQPKHTNMIKATTAARAEASTGPNPPFQRSNRKGIRDRCTSNDAKAIPGGTVHGRTKQLFPGG